MAVILKSLVHVVMHWREHVLVLGQWTWESCKACTSDIRRYGA